MAPSKKPKSSEEPTAAKSVLVSRVIAPMQSVGRAGKSTLNDALLSWLTGAGVHWGAMDLDSEHHTLSDRYEGFVKGEADGPADMNMMQFSLGDPEAVRELLGILIEQAQAGALQPVIVLDCPAQATEGLLADFRQYHALQVLADHNIRLTVPLILSDDPAAATSLGKIIEDFEDRADYMLVRNPRVRKSVQIEQRRKVRELIDAGTPVIDMPSISEATMREIAALERADRHFPLAEAAKRLSPIARMEVESFLWQTAYQFEDAESILVPNGGTIQTRIDRNKFPRPAAPASRKNEKNNLD